MQTSLLQRVLSLLVTSLIYSKWRFNNCQARLLIQHQNTDIHRRQKIPRVEKGQSKLTANNTHDILSNHSIWIRIHAAWYLAKEDIAMIKFDSFIDANLVLQGQNPAECYRDDRVAWESAVAVALHFRKGLKERVKQSPYFGIMIDETTDTSINQQLIIYIKFLDRNQSDDLWKTVVEYLDLTSPENSTASCITIYRFRNKG